MTDRELLELAAKAYWGEEIDDVCSIRWCDADQAIGYTHGDNQDHNGRDVEWLWDPLNDDGDALRLAVKLNLLFPSPEMLMHFLMLERFSRQGDNDCVATRRAIVRAAAEIGGAK